MAETVVSDPAGQAAVDRLPQSPLEAEISPDNLATQPETAPPDPEPQTPVAEVSWPPPDPPKR